MFPDQNNQPTQFPLLRPAAPVPPVYDPNRFSWVKYLKGGANILNEWDEKHYSSPTHAVSIAGLKLIYLNDDALISQVLQDTTGKFVRSKLQAQILDPILGQGLLSVDGEVWRKQRKVMAPVFQPRQVADFEEHMRQSTERLVDQWTETPPRRALDVIPAMSSLTLDFIANALFGGLEAEQHKMLANNTHRGLSRVPMLNAALLLNPFKSHNQSISRFTFRKQIRQLDEIAQNFVRRYRDGGSSEQNTLLARLIEAQEAEQNSAIDQIYVRDQIATFLLAGHETTGKALAFALYVLAFDKVRCDHLVEDIQANGEDSVYLDWVIKEVLRLYPPAVVINRDAAEDVELNGEQVSKGTTLMISPWLVNRNPETWQHADKFWPERWETENLKQRRYSYLPFGAGPRVCIGAALALSELKIMLAGLLKNFDFSPSDIHDVEPALAVTLSATNGIWLNVTPRK
ncbi:MAG: cytochrome P450 [Alphaproteobacteria bacterium]